jgi:hypothetical protein
MMEIFQVLPQPTALMFIYAGNKINTGKDVTKKGTLV